MYKITPILFIVIIPILLSLSCNYLEESVNKPESYIVPVNSGIMDYGKAKNMTLNTIKSWNGSESKEIHYSPSKTPWVVNAGFSPKSSLGSKFEAYVWKDFGNGSRVLATQAFGRTGIFNGITAVAVEDIGNYIIQIQSSGGDWWAKIGVEITDTVTKTSPSPTVYPGTIKVVSGTGTFSAILSNSLSITVKANEIINGTIGLIINNNIPRDALAPLIVTPSWGDHSTSWWLLNKTLSSGLINRSVNINIKAPDKPGNYNLIFAFSGEKTGEQVASGTNWTVANPVWNDGNDIADFNSTQIAQAQRDGRTTNNWITNEGKKSIDLPACAVKIVVGK